MKPSTPRSRLRRRLTALGVVAGLSLVSLGAGIVAGTWRAVCHDCPSVAQVYAWEPRRSTRILGHDGRVVAELFEERRTPVPIKDLPRHVPQAFIAVEDQQFYRHGGFNPWGIFRSAVRGALRRRVSGGGSTITQQLARHMFIQEVGFEQRFRRKLKELKVAQQLEQVYTKDQILEAYLNQVNYGPGWYGIETAARRYFGRAATSLDPAQAALLAAVINSPGFYSPFKHPERARARRNTVLELMVDEGYLEEKEADRWQAEPLPSRPQGGGEGDLAPYFVEWVRDELDARFGGDLYRKGLRIYTTLDVEMQRRAAEAMQAGWARIEGSPGYRHPRYAEIEQRRQVGQAAPAAPPNQTPYLQGLFVALDPATGEIRALIGGRDFDDSKFNRVVQARRQAGSVFKPFVYAAAIAAGTPASHVLVDEPLTMDQPDGTVWAPKNYDGQFDGPMTLRHALRGSINIPAIKLGLEIGLETVARTARRMGIETPVPEVPSVSIGAADVIPLQVAEAYTAFATGGVRVRPRAVLRVEDAEGRVLLETRPDTARVLEPAAAALMRNLLRDVVDRGTAYAVRDPARGNVPYELAAGGKTGTTNDATDVWFAGFTPDLLAVVWFGFDRRREILGNADGGRFAAPVWGQFMRSVYYGETPLRPRPAPWPESEELISRAVDGKSGKLATEWCPVSLVYAELFIPGTEPTEPCDLHGPFGSRPPLDHDTLIVPRRPGVRD